MSENKRELFEQKQRENQIESTPLKYWKYKDNDGLEAIFFSSQKSLLEFKDVQAAYAYRDKQLKEIVGVKDSELASTIHLDASEAIRSLGNSEAESRNIVLQALHDIQPKDSMEASLCAQERALYAHAMRNLKRAGDADRLEHIETLTNLSIKLMRVHNETIETLSRYRRGGEQKVTVQHTVIADKAIVNNITEVGTPPKNRGSTPCSINNAEQGQGPMTIDHVVSPQWPTAGVDCTEEKVLVRKQKKVKNEEAKLV